MPKTVYSQRNPLTPSELKAYQRNKQKAARIRAEFLKAHPDFTYCKVFTEARAKGRCRTKFWLVNLSNQIMFGNWMLNHYPKYNVVYQSATPGWWFPSPGVAITVG